jgi:DNA methylase
MKKRPPVNTDLSRRNNVIPFLPMPAKGKSRPAQRPPTGKPSSLLDTRIVYCGDCLDQLRKLPDACVDLIYIDPPFNSNRNYEVFWGETKEKRAFEDRHASTQAYIKYMRPRCVELPRILKKTGSLYYHCDWHASRRCHWLYPSSTLFMGGRTS